MHGSQRTNNPKAAALLGSVGTLPLIAANAIVGNRIEPFFSFIRPGPHTSIMEYVLLGFGFACLPIGAFIAARPLCDRDADGRRRLYLLNGLTAVFMLAVFVVLVAGLGAEVYRCDVLKIPNCD